MAYTPFSSSKPSGGSSGPTFATDANTNDIALRDMVVLGGEGSLDWALTYEGAAGKPTALIAANGTQKYRWELTWSGNYITQIVAKYLPSVSTYDTVRTWTFSYSGNQVISGNVGSMLLSRVLGALGHTFDTYDALVTHAALTGAAAHNNGTMSTQNANGIAITGGTINGASFGLTTAGEVRATRVTETYYSRLDERYIVNYIKFSDYRYILQCSK
jgi:hypothetical protein